MMDGGIDDVNAAARDSPPLFDKLTMYVSADDCSSALHTTEFVMQWRSYRHARVGTCPFISNSRSWNLQRFNDFWGNVVGWGRVSSVISPVFYEFLGKCVCRLQILYVHHWAFCTHTTPELYPWIPPGNFRPQTSGAHPPYLQIVATPLLIKFQYSF